MAFSGNVDKGLKKTDTYILVMFWIPEGLRPLIFQRSQAKTKCQRALIINGFDHRETYCLLTLFYYSRSIGIYIVPASRNLLRNSLSLLGRDLCSLSDFFPYLYELQKKPPKQSE